MSGVVRAPANRRRQFRRAYRADPIGLGGHPYAMYRNNLLGNNITSMARRKYRSRRRRRSRRSKKSAWKKPLVAPWSIIRKLPTSWYNSLNPGAGTLSVDIIKLNSAYDPSGSISPSIQGMGMDQYEALYNKYCVVGYKLHITAISTDNSNPVTIGFTPTTTSSTLSSQHRYMELPGTVYRVVTPDIDRVTFTVKGSCKKHLLPRGGKLLTDDTFASGVGGDPTKLLYGHIWAQAQDNAADPGVIQYTIKVQQLVVFYDPKTPARSTQ